MICQKYTHEIQEMKLTEAKGTKRFIEAANTRLDDCYFRIQADIENLICHSLPFHKSCYSAYTTKSNLKFVRSTSISNIVDEIQTSPVPIKNTRQETGHAALSTKNSV